MEDISRRDALSKIAGGGAGLALSLSGNTLVHGEELKEKASRLRALKQWRRALFVVNTNRSLIRNVGSQAQYL
jgi:hypothetical protein